MKFKPTVVFLKSISVYEASMEVDFAKGKVTVYERARSRKDAINLLRVTLGKLLKPETAYHLVPKELPKPEKPIPTFELICDSSKYDVTATWEHNVLHAVRWDADPEDIKSDVFFYIKEWLPEIAEDEGYKIKLPDK